MSSMEDRFVNAIKRDAGELDNTASPVITDPHTLNSALIDTQANLAEANERIAQLESELSELHASDRSRTREHNILVGENRMQNDAIKQFKSALAGLDLHWTEIERMGIETNEIRKENESLKSALALADKNYMHAQADYDAACEHVDELNGELARLHKAHELLKDECACILADNRRLIEERDALVRRLDEVAGERTH